MNVRILQWNVLFRERADRILEILRKTDADILCLQELTSISGHNKGLDVPSHIAEELKFQFFYQIAQEWDSPGDRHTLGNGIFSRWNLLRTEATFVRPSQGPNPHDPSKEGRIYAEADIGLPDGSTLTIGTTHLSYIPRGTMTHEKKDEVEALLEKIKKHESRYVLTGDFNEPPDSYIIQSLEQRFQHCGPPYTELTWPTRTFRSMRHIEWKLGYRIDYVFASKDLHVTSSHTINTHVSDHLPILTELEIPTP